MTLVVLLATAPSVFAAKFYVVVRGVEDADGVKSGIKEEALRVFKDELGRRPELTLTPPPGLPAGDDPTALKAALKAKGLKALELTLRILSVKQELAPPPAGKKFRVLSRSIKLSVFGDTLPDKVLAIGGDGESQVAAEINANANLEAEGKPLLVDATKEAVKQAVDMTVAKLQVGDKQPKLKKKK
ncbi:MAG: hypothetical protein JWN44_1408 [Myxococcales bacterium]|nr:hypothetical protein [Myxococcales bacterium]